MLAITPLVLMACQKEERQVIPTPEPEQQEDIDMEQFRVEGDRLATEPVLGTLERQERFVEQYETVDRPILMNTIRLIREYDTEHEGSFEGVRLITDKSIDEVKEKKLAEYTENLGGELSPQTTQVYDITTVYPYTEDDYSSYYDTVIKILQEEVLVRTQTYNGIKSHIENRSFDLLKKSGIVRNFQDAIDVNGGMLEQVRPYIQEMDKLVAQIRQSLEMEKPKYTTIDSPLEEVAEYKVPQKATVQEIISIEPTSDLYEDYSEDIEEEKTTEEQEETEDVDNTEE